MPWWQKGVGDLTKRQLEAYRSNERLIERNREKIESEELKDIPIVYGKVKSSMKEFPYIETHTQVQMDQPDEKDKSKKRISKWKKEIDEAEKKNEEVRYFINGIEDIRDSKILKLRYVDGCKVAEIGKIFGYTKGRVSQIISHYTKD